MPDEESKVELSAVLSALAASISDDVEAHHVHIVDDLDFLDRWSHNLVSEEESESALQHLARCAECRTFVGEMIEDGMLDVCLLRERSAGALEAEPANLPNRPQPKDLATPPVGNANSGRWAVAAVAVAASLILGLLLWPPDNNPHAALVNLDTWMRTQNYDKAFALAADLLNSDVDADVRQKSREYLKSSGDQLLAAAYTQGQNAKIRDISGTYARHRIRSGAAEFYGIASELGATDALFTAGKGRLDELFGLGLNGKTSGREKGFGGAFAPEKDLVLPTTAPVGEEEFNRLETRLTRAVQEFPQHDGLRINLGHVLLGAAKYDEAREQFQVVAVRDARNSVALVGQGLAEFQLGEYESAAGSFQKALDGDPSSLTAMFNLAVALESSDHKSEARATWRDLRTLTSDVELQRLIDMHLREQR
jgi:tetratricopeptide (TPR) repeat protein